MYVNPLLLLLVIGALIGKQKGRNIEVMNSFELVFSVIDGDIIIDRDYYNLKEEQCEYLTILYYNALKTKQPRYSVIKPSPFKLMSTYNRQNSVYFFIS